MSTRVKFNEGDRRRVVAFLEGELGVRLRNTPRSRKLLVDDDGRPYVVVGAHEHWHGVRRPYLDGYVGRAVTVGGRLVVALRSDRGYRVFAGPLQPLIEHRSRLSETRGGDYHFHTEPVGGGLRVAEVPTLVLREIGAMGSPAPFPPSPPPSPPRSSRRGRRTREGALERTLASFGQLPPDKQQEVISLLQQEAAMQSGPGAP